MKQQLFLLHFAGGNRFSFQSIIKKLSCDFAVEPLELPGRGKRFNESLIVNEKEAVEDLLKQIKDKRNGAPYIIFGHSMGALMAYLLCQRMYVQEAILLPVKLVVSGKKPPSIERENLIAHLPDRLFWEEVVKMGGIPEELHDHPELIDFYLPIIRADFETIENYKYVEGNKLDIPIDVFYGSEEEITKEEIKAWAKETTGEVIITELEGNHFFIFKHIDFFTNYFENLTKGATFLS